MEALGSWCIHTWSPVLRAVAPGNWIIDSWSPVLSEGLFRSILSRAEDWNLGLGFDSIHKVLAQYAWHTCLSCLHLGAGGSEVQGFSKLSPGCWAQRTEWSGKCRESGFGSFSWWAAE